jgi:hypothetical protein
MSSIQTIAGVIQLAIAPAFLLGGIAALLGVFANRLGRLVDRARIIERRIPGAKREDQLALLRTESAALWRRTTLLNWAVRFCIGALLSICLVIVTLFVGEFVTIKIVALIAVLFVTAMLSLIVGLMLLLHEVTVGTRHMRQGMEVALEGGTLDAR